MIKYKISRKLDHKKMLIRNLSTSLIIYEKIKTTRAKAKITKSIVDKKISDAKKNNLAARRESKKFFTDKNAINKIFDVLIKRYAKRNSGFVKIFKLKSRLGDGSQMAQLQLVPEEKQPKHIKDKNKVSKK